MSRPSAAKREMKLHSALCGAFVLLAVGASIRAMPASATDAYPSRPIRLVVGFGAGGPTDIPARFIADKLGTALKQSVVVENKPAAGGIVATRDVLAQPRDGYTLLLCTHFDATNVAVYRDAGYRLSDIAPISLIAKYYYGLALANTIPAQDFKSFVAYAKAHPGEVTYATVGAASAQEIMARQLGKLTGVTMNRIPFRGGLAVVQELIAGRVDLYPSPTLAIMPYYKSRQLKILATTSPQRLAILPEVPTLKEVGFDFIRFGWLGVCAGAGTPAPIVNMLNRHIASIVASPAYRALIENAGSIAGSSTPQELGAIMQKTMDDIIPAVKEFGLQQP
ncbi:MAG: tripartite tricarboxylate transporter substrate binding protein [Xanthobacteraceae bacterium]